MTSTAPHAAPQHHVDSTSRPPSSTPFLPPSSSLTRVGPSPSPSPVPPNPAVSRGGSATPAAGSPIKPAPVRGTTSIPLTRPWTATPTPVPQLPPAPTPAAAQGWPRQVEAGPSDPNKAALVRKRKWVASGYTQPEIDILEARASSLHLALLLDQQETLFPPPPTRFTSSADVVKRLLPWHVWQIHDEELDLPQNEQLEKQRVQREMTDTDNIVRRMASINHRLHKLREREAERPSDLASLIILSQSSTAQIREELGAVNAVYRPLFGKQQVHEADQRRKANEAAAAAQAALQAKQRAAAAAAAANSSTAQQSLFPQKRSPFPPNARSPTATTSARPPPPAQNRPVASPAAAPAPGPSADAHTALRTALEKAAQSPRPSTASPPATPNTPGTPSPDSAANQRGRPRGRPRGRGRGGLREAVLTHSATSNTPAPTTPSATTASPSTVSPGGRSTRSSAAPTPSTPSPAPNGSGSSTATPSSPASSGAPPTGPVTITVSKPVIQQFLALGLLHIPSRAGVKAPANILRTTEDDKHVVSVNLALCNPAQLGSLAKMFNVPWKGASNAAGPPKTPTTPRK